MNQNKISVTTKSSNLQLIFSSNYLVYGEASLEEISLYILAYHQGITMELGEEAFMLYLCLTTLSQALKMAFLWDTYFFPHRIILSSVSLPHYTKLLRESWLSCFKTSACQESDNCILSMYLTQKPLRFRNKAQSQLTSQRRDCFQYRCKWDQSLTHCINFWPPIYVNLLTLQMPEWGRF